MKNTYLIIALTLFLTPFSMAQTSDTLTVISEPEPLGKEAEVSNIPIVISEGGRNFKENNVEQISDSSIVISEGGREKKINDIKTLYKGDASIGGFISIDTKMGHIHNATSIMTGAKVGLILNHSFYIGAAGYGAVTGNSFYVRDPEDIDADGNYDEKLYLTTGYGGLLVGATLFSNEIVHLTVPIIIGAGAIQIDSVSRFNQDFMWDGGHWSYMDEVETSAYFVFEPGLELEVNLTKHFRMALGASYRNVLGSQLANLTDEDLSNFAGHLSFKFGFF